MKRTSPYRHQVETSLMDLGQAFVMLDGRLVKHRGMESAEKWYDLFLRALCVSVFLIFRTRYHSARGLKKPFFRSFYTGSSEVVFGPLS